MSDLPVRTRRVLEWIQHYAAQHQITPTYREIAAGLGYRSVSPVQRHIGLLEAAGLVSRVGRMSRSLRLSEAAAPVPGIPIYGAIAASSLVEIFPDTEVEYVMPELLQATGSMPERFALRVRGDSMVGALIDQGDIVLLERPADPRRVKNGSIVAARVEGKTTLKRWQRQGNRVWLHPENPDYSVIEVSAQEVEIQGVYVGLIRGLM